MTNAPAYRRLKRLHAQVNARRITSVVRHSENHAATRRLSHQLARAQASAQSQNPLAQRMWRLQQERVRGIRQAWILERRWETEWSVPIRRARTAPLWTHVLKGAGTTFSRMAAPLWEWLMTPLVDTREPLPVPRASNASSPDGAYVAKAA